MQPCFTEGISTNTPANQAKATSLINELTAAINTANSQASSSSNALERRQTALAVAEVLAAVTKVYNIYSLCDAVSQ